MPGKRLDSQARHMVALLIDYFTAESRNKGPLIPFNAIMERVANSLNISMRTVKRIKDSVQRNEGLQTPGLSRPRLSRKSDDLDENKKSEVRNIIFNMYADKKQVTLRGLAEELTLKNVLSAHPKTVSKLLMNLGFKYKKDDNRRSLVERKNIALMRINFFRKYMQNKYATYPRQLVFLDETCLYDGKESPTKSSQGESTKSARKSEGSDGKRFTALHAGTDKGFVNTAALMYATKTKLPDNHVDMNSKIFLRWLQENLIPNLDKPSLIVMDNASYHNIILDKPPTVSWSKDQIKEWLVQNNIPFNNFMFKVELLNLVKQHNVPIRNKIDKVIQDNGHEVLRLPPYHCQFNAINMIWREAKDYYYRHIGEEGYADNNVYSMWERAMQICSPELWKSCVAQTEKVIEEWYDRERIIENIPELIIHVGADSEDESESNDDSDS